MRKAEGKDKLTRHEDSFIRIHGCKDCQFKRIKNDNIYCKLEHCSKKMKLKDEAIVESRNCKSCSYYLGEVNCGAVKYYWCGRHKCVFTEKQSKEVACEQCKYKHVDRPCVGFCLMDVIKKYER